MTMPATPPVNTPDMPRPRGKPSLGHWFLHIRRTLRLIGALMADRRVPIVRKLLFIVSIIIFGVVLIIPDSLIIAASAAVLPILSPFIGIPAGVIDVAALALALYLLLSFFPKQLVSEHTTRLWGPNADLRPHRR